MSRLLEWEPSPPWMRDAACRGMDPELFFPEKGASWDVQEARGVCAGCPVRTECLTYAMDHTERHGVWGGTSERERRRLRRGEALMEPRHGTAAGYRAHSRAGTSPCEPCKAAIDLEKAIGRAKRRGADVLHLVANPQRRRSA